jgi:hypothetical protein
MPFFLHFCKEMKSFKALFLVLSFTFIMPSISKAAGDEPLIGGPSFRLTPNPVNGSFFHVNLDFNANEYPDAGIIISDVLGKTVYFQTLKQSDFAERRVRISVMDANLDKGVYFLQIKSGDTSKTQKLAIR